MMTSITFLEQKRFINNLANRRRVQNQTNRRRNQTPCDYTVQVYVTEPIYHHGSIADVPPSSSLIVTHISIFRPLCCKKLTCFGAYFMKHIGTMNNIFLYFDHWPIGAYISSCLDSIFAEAGWQWQQRQLF